MKKRSVSILGHATSVTLEDEFWTALKTIAKQRNISLNEMIARIDARRGTRNLSSAIRIAVLKAVQNG